MLLLVQCSYVYLVFSNSKNSSRNRWGPNFFCRNRSSFDSLTKKVVKARRGHATCFFECQEAWFHLKQKKLKKTQNTSNYYYITKYFSFFACQQLPTNRSKHSSIIFLVLYRTTTACTLFIMTFSRHFFFVFAAMVPFALVGIFRSVSIARNAISTGGGILRQQKMSNKIEQKEGNDADINIDISTVTGSYYKSSNTVVDGK